MGIILEAVISPAVGSAAQDRVPVIRSLVMTNDSDGTAENIRIVIRPEPAFAKAKAINVKSLGPHMRAGIKNADLALDREFLSGIAERTEGSVTVTAEMSGRTVSEKRYGITVLANGEWFGVNAPELIVSFISPDDPEVLRIAANAARMLGAWTGASAMDRYASGDRSKVRKEVSAIYSAIQQFDVRCTALPADVHRTGGRISPAKRIVDEMCATPLDLTLLFLSCAGSVGLNTVIIFTKGRVTAGVWTEDTSFSPPVQRDPGTIMRSVRDGSLMLIDCEGMTSNKRTDIESSETSAKRTLLNESDFLLALDVGCARGNAAPKPGPDAKLTVEKKRVTAGSQALPETHAAAPKAAASNELTKREEWERRLLDLSFGNELLSMRMSDTLLPIMTNNISALKDTLISGNELRILGKPTEWDSQVLNEVPFELSRHVGRHEVLIEQEFRSRTLRSPYGEKDVRERLSRIHAAAKAGEENGEGLLYITLGLLKWTDNDGRTVYAPLILMPAETVARSVNDDITVKARDAEPIINRTLTGKLKRDHNVDISLDPLPADRTGVDTASVFSTVKEAVRTMDGWDVVEGAFIGIFRPERCDMWNDLRSRSDLLFSNKLTKSLMEGKLSWLPRPINDTDLQKKMLFAFEADHSQMRAVKAAADGRTFVMNAPSGTGRTQTIANIIANTLYSKRTVLLISEKDASLRAVKERLNEAGAGRSCLHLNPGNAEKKRVLDHFRAVLDSASCSYVEGFRLKAEMIDRMCSELTGPVSALRKMTGCGMSIYDLIIQYDRIRGQKAEKMDIPGTIADSVTPDSAGKWEMMVSELVSAAKALRHPSGHPLSDTGISEFGDGTEEMIRDALDGWISSEEDAAAAASGLLASVDSKKSDGADELAQLLISLSGMPEGIIGTGSVTAMNEKLRELPKVMRHSFEVINSLTKTFDADLKEDVAETLEKHRTRMRSALDALSGADIPDIDKENFERYIYDVFAVKEKMEDAVPLLKEVRTEWNDPVLTADIGALTEKWNGIGSRKLFSGGAKKTFMNDISKYLKNTSVTFEEFPGAIRPVQDYLAHIDEAKKMLAGIDVLSGGGNSELTADCRTLESMHDRISSILSSLAQYGDPDTVCRSLSSGTEIRDLAADRMSKTERAYERRMNVEELLVTDISKAAGSDDMNGWKKLRDRWMADIKEFRKIAAWNKCRNALAAEGLECVADAYMDGMGHDMVLPSFTVSLYGRLMNAYIAKEPSLAEFDAEAHADKAAKFADGMEKFITVCRAELDTTLSSGVPDVTTDTSPETEKLQRAIATAGRGVTVRSLLREIGSMIPAVCPCMMMSPYAVSHYLDHDLSFDLVIIDDASLMPLYKAIDAMTRGKDAVIAGDINILPADENERQESVMDACVSLSLPRCDLEWNYKDEELTEFMNAEFYGTAMNTFPSAGKKERRITSVHVNGCYDRSSRTNEHEAEAAVKAVMAHLKERGEGKSIGVVVFSEGQRELTENVLTKELAGHPALATAMHTDEAVFVKNAGSVQSDERDTIVISLGIGPDASGRMTADLYPFSREDGGGRLNAALSSARKNIIVLTSLKASDTHSDKEGMKALKDLLEYTENGLKCAPCEKDELRDEIARAISERGYKVCTGIGSSKARIDLGIEDPEHKGCFILGIVLDNGPFSGYDAMETDFVHRKMLAKAGWSLYRLWTTAWSDDRGKELKNMTELVKKRLEDPERWIVRPSEKSTESISIIKRPPAKAEARRVKQSYEKAEVMEKTVSLEALFSNSSRGMIERDIMKVIETESPVSDTVVAQRLCDAYGMQKASARLIEYIRKIISGMNVCSTMTPWNTKILWNDVQGVTSYKTYRTPPEGEVRNIKDIAAKEMINAMIETIIERPGIDVGDLMTAVANVFGHQSIDNGSAEIISMCIDLAISERFIRKNSKGNVSLDMRDIS